MGVAGGLGAVLAVAAGSMTAPIVIDSATVPLETWDTPARGTICWQTLLSAGITQSNSLVCGVATLEKGDNFALHHHAEPEVYFGVEGETIVTVDGKACPLSPGVAIFIPANAVHGIAAVTNLVRFFYVFAADSFNDIDYHFVKDPTHTN